MIRLLFILALVVGLSAAGAWVVDHPGSVTIALESHRLDTSVAALALTVAALMVVSALLMLLWRWLTTGIWERRKLSRHRRGYNELAWGLSALMEGDGRRAGRHARKFESLVGQTALSDVLAGQAALAEGDVATARTRFRALEGDRKTKALALRGLFAVEATQGDRSAMLSTAKRAIDQMPRADWAQSGLYESAVALGDWPAADKALQAALKAKRISEEEFRHRRAAIRLAEARKAEADGKEDDALKLSREAIKLDAELVPARLLGASIYRKKGAMRRAKALIRDGWRHLPHPELASAWLSLAEDRSPTMLYKHLETLTAEKQDLEGHLALGRQAIAADLTGPARTHLNAASEVAPQRRVFQAMETLERKLGNEASAQYAASKAAHAERDSAWQCDACGYRQSAWSELCGNCGAFASLEWKRDGKKDLPAATS